MKKGFITWGPDPGQLCLLRSICPNTLRFYGKIYNMQEKQGLLIPHVWTVT